MDAVPLPHQQEPLAFGIRPDDDRWTAFVAGTRMAFISVQADEAEYYIKSNKREAETVAHLVHTLCQLHSRSGIPFSPCKQIGIIVPFRAQIAMIRKALAERHIPDTADITIDTVERYQAANATSSYSAHCQPPVPAPYLVRTRHDRRLGIRPQAQRGPHPGTQAILHDRKRNAAPEMHGLPGVSDF